MRFVLAAAAALVAAVPAQAVTYTTTVRPTGLNTLIGAPGYAPEGGRYRYDFYFPKGLGIEAQYAVVTINEYISRIDAEPTTGDNIERDTVFYFTEQETRGDGFYRAYVTLPFLGARVINGLKYTNFYLNSEAVFTTPTNTPFDLTVSFNAVPEPATWAMMIVGFGMVGGAMRRSSRAGSKPTRLRHSH